MNEIALYIHIKPPSLQVLEERLRSRNTDTEDTIIRRLDVAKKELEFGTYSVILIPYSCVIRCLRLCFHRKEMGT